MTERTTEKEPLNLAKNMARHIEFMVSSGQFGGTVKQYAAHVLCRYAEDFRSRVCSALGLATNEQPVTTETEGQP